MNRFEAIMDWNSDPLEELEKRLAAKEKEILENNPNYFTDMLLLPKDVHVVRQTGASSSGDITVYYSSMDDY